MVKITGSFYEKELEKTNRKRFRIEEIRKIKGDKLYVKCKGYDNHFNSWVNKKRHCMKMSQHFPNSPSDYENI